MNQLGLGSITLKVPYMNIPNQHASNDFKKTLKLIVQSYAIFVLSIDSLHSYIAPLLYMVG